MELHNILRSSIAPSTRATYNVGTRRFELFCRQINVQCYPPSEQTLMFFATSLSKHISFKSIKVYLAAIQYHTILKGWSIKMNNMNRLYYTLRGIRRVQGNTFTRPPRSPFTMNLILKLHSSLYLHFSFLDAHMIKAASLIAFFGLLRASEYLSKNSRQYDSADTLLFNEINFDRTFSHVTIHIKKSKTDPFRQGCNIKVWAINQHYCPVRCLRLYHTLNTFQGPLFQFQNGTYLTRRALSHIIQLCLPQTNLNTHSFRIGGASAAFTAGVPETTIQTMGRWASDAYKLYLRLTHDTIRDAQNRMSSVTHSNPWHPHQEENVEDSTTHP